MLDNRSVPPKPATGFSVREYLSQHHFFKDLPDALIEQLVDAAEEIAVEPETRIFRQDSDADAFYVVLDGQVQIEVPAVAGEPAMIQVIGDGRLLGWSWLIPPHRWHFDARALRASRLLKIDGVKLRDACRADKELGYTLLERAAVLMMERLDAARRQVMENYTGEG